MTPRKTHLSGFIKRVRFYNDAQVAAIIEDLGLIPEFLITKDMVEQYRRALREKATSENAVKENVRIAIAYTEELLNSEYGRWLVEKYRERFSFNIPENRL